jgi:cytidylate kinase
LLLAASNEFNIPEIKLIRAIHDAPSILDRMNFGKEKYLSYLQTALLRRVMNGNVVYHGLAGHFLLKGIPHVLMIRIMANMEDRIAEEMARENINEKEALHILRKDDQERRAWSRYVFNADPWSPELYHCVFKIGKCSVDDVVNAIVKLVQQSRFQSTPSLQKLLNDKLLASQAKASLLPKFPKVKTTCNEGVVRVYLNVPRLRKQNTIREIRKLLGKSGIDCRTDILVNQPKPIDNNIQII